MKIKLSDNQFKEMTDKINSGLFDFSFSELKAYVRKSRYMANIHQNEIDLYAKDKVKPNHISVAQVGNWYNQKTLYIGFLKKIRKIAIKQRDLKKNGSEFK